MSSVWTVGLGRPLLPLVVMACVGCVSVQSYPESWAPRTLGGTGACPDLTGTYSDAGEVPSGKTQVSLARWLFNDAPNATEPETVVMRLAQNDSELQIQVLEGSTVLFERSLRSDRNELSCDGGLLMIPRSKGTNREGVVSYQSGSIELSRSESTLIAKSSGGGAGVMLLIPVVFYGSNYARFPKID